VPSVALAPATVVPLVLRLIIELFNTRRGADVEGEPVVELPQPLLQLELILVLRLRGGQVCNDLF
jgi:hypothetical protein